MKRFYEVLPKSPNPEKLRTLSEADGSHSLPCTVDRLLGSPAYGVSQGGMPAPDDHSADLMRTGVGEQEHTQISKGPGGCPSE